MLEAIVSDDQKTREHGWWEIFNQVLHQGTLYPATEPVVAWMIDGLEDSILADEPVVVNARENMDSRAVAFSFLSAAAESASHGSRDPQACSRSAGCSPEVYASLANAVLETLRAHVDLLMDGLVDPDPVVRAASAATLKHTAIDRAECLAGISAQYDRETSGPVRVGLLAAMSALADREEEWCARLDRILEKGDTEWEKFYAAACLARRRKPGTSESIATALAHSFAKISDLPAPDVDPNISGVAGVEYSLNLFWAAVTAMPTLQAVRCVADALQWNSNEYRLPQLVEWLLRLASHDQRIGWEKKTWQKTRQGIVVRYSAVQCAPGSTVWIQSTKWVRSEEGKVAVNALLGKDDVWRIETSLWELFGLPGTRDALRRLIAAPRE